MPGIFLSYRREDSFAYAGRLYDHLANHLGKDNVFMDVDHIEPGLDFVEVLQQRVSSCDVLVAVIGKQWLTATDERGRRRLDDPEDLVRLEIAAALDRKIRVVPTLVGGAPMPRAHELPEALARLSRRNALEISDLAFHQSVGRLIDALDKAVQHVHQAAAPRSAAVAAETPSSPAASNHPNPAPAAHSAAVRTAEVFPQTSPSQSRPNPASTAHPSPDPAAEAPITQPPPMRAKPAAPPATVSAWRRLLLFYKPRGIGGWLVHILYYFFAFATFSGTMAYVSGEPWGAEDWWMLGTFSVLTLILRLIAFWIGKGAGNTAASL
jgi:hypothetical protein